MGESTDKRPEAGENIIDLNDEEEFIDEEEEEEYDEENNDIIRAKWCIDGCKTLEECAQALEAYAEHMRQLKQEGWELTEEVSDDYGFIHKEH